MNLIPTVCDKFNGNEKFFDIYSLLLKERIIFLTGEINEEVSALVISQLLYLDSISNDDVQIYINSPGGSVTDGLAIVDCMNHIKSDVCTICIGMCASMASIILANGKKGKRYILENGEVMIHQPLGGVQGQESDVSIVALRLTKIKNKLIKLLSTLTGKSEEKIKDDSDRDYYMDANEAKKYGIVDKVLK